MAIIDGEPSTYRERPITYTHDRGSQPIRQDWSPGGDDRFRSPSGRIKDMRIKASWHGKERQRLLDEAAALEATEAALTAEYGPRIA